MNHKSFYRSQVINELDLAITTHCNLRCPECSAFIPYLSKHEHYEIEYIQEIAKYFKNIEILKIVGGEPMIHPRFQEIVPNLRQMFNCKQLVLNTNGFNVKKNIKVLGHFDYLLVSKYAGNQNEVDFIKDHLLDKKAPQPTYHVSLSKRANNAVPCWRNKAGVFVVHGKVFPCCMALGPDSIGIKPSENWREEIINIPMPCETCCFAEERDSPIGYNWLYEQDPFSSPKIEGVHGDLWVSKEAYIIINIDYYLKLKTKKITLKIESLAPDKVFPLTVSASINQNVIDELSLSNHEMMQWGFSIEHMDHDRDIILTLNCDKSFCPSEYNKDNYDTRVLSFRLLSLEIR